ncbi:putative virion structural protein [Klebsiella phage N1M2]|uniref:Putative virion structural protein n=1 Tax=Klebsiella phage N1M2 TaxID=2664939 RepID=A0A6B7ZFR2_9CAUD|nr:putative virion structural protein [Klebsiella phage N1M2]QGH72114.1 putative virion structural protein [Klebsiella phage N1M2]
MKMVGPLLNVAGGTTEIIDLSAAHIENLSGGIIAVNVPDFMTGGRRILSVLEVYPGNINRAINNGYNFNNYAACGSGMMNNSLNRLINGLDDGQVQRSFTSFTMTGNNSFIIRDAGSAMFNMIAKVILSYDEHFSVIPPRMYDKFAELVELGVKAYIYKTCRRGMQEAVSRFGVTVEDVQDDIQGYADAHREFKDLYNNEIKKYLAYADPKGKSDAIKMTVPRKR